MGGAGNLPQLVSDGVPDHEVVALDPPPERGGEEDAAVAGVERPAADRENFLAKKKPRKPIIPFIGSDQFDKDSR